MLYYVMMPKYYRMQSLSCLFMFQIKLILNYILMLDIFQEAGLPLWLRPYEVLCTSSYTALIETIPDTV